MTDIQVENSIKIVNTLSNFDSGRSVTTVSSPEKIAIIQDAETANAQFFGFIAQRIFEDENSYATNANAVAEVVSNNPQTFAKVVRAWDYAREQYEITPADTNNIQKKEDWDQRGMDYYTTLSGLLWYGLPAETLRKGSISGQDQNFLESGPFGAISNLLSDPDFSSRNELIRFLNYELVRAHNQVEMTRTVPDLAIVDQQIFENKKRLLVPLLLKAAVQSAEQQDKATLRHLMIGFKNADAETEAASLLCQTELSETERLRIAVEYINTFGFIHTVDVVASQIETSNNNPQLHQQLLRLYGAIQGEETRAIAAELSAIYEKVDFSSYHLNNDERVRAEANRLEKNIAQLNGEHKELCYTTNTLDIGAGAGPHCLSLRRRGYTNITAFEYEKKHVDFIRSQDPDLPVVQGDWHRLNETLRKEKPGKLPVKFAYSLGRTIAHNRTPVHMLHFFDEVHQALDSKGRFLFDVPGIDWGVYQERTENIQNNLQALGVDAIQSSLVFDGPNDIDRFNRMILTDRQVDALAHMLGYRLVESDQEIIGEQGEIKNMYHVLEKVADWNPQSLNAEVFGKYAVTLGLLDPGTNFNTYVDAWGMSIAEAFVFASTCGIGNEYIRYLHEQGNAPRVTVEMQGNRPIFQLSGMSTESMKLANAAKGLTREQMLKLIASEHPAKPDQI